MRKDLTIMLAAPLLAGGAGGLMAADGMGRCGAMSAAQRSLTASTRTATGR
jgi:hypothetical protein